MIGIALGGFLGAIARYGFYLMAESRARQPKLATWLVNSLGSLALGMFIGAGSVSPFWMVGFLGAFTTFSTMALDAVKDVEDGRLLEAASYLGATLVSGIVLFSTGYHLLH
ncbi:fluoride efflux transporter FluC [Planococcus sp. APC 3906]|uniref:fluoride efflux transporter FluC n=1 Tax=Planococcus TaxID=1372 RepID=UPI0025B3FA8A|nr:CrcB family protein [Planococcus sp. APC 3906]MDN3451632.1 CrcB family protein [Planococcus sp. APC 3906]